MIDDFLKDAPFAKTAVIIGLFYALIAWGLGTLVGGAAASAASIALTAFAAAIFRKYESLRFPVPNDAPLAQVDFPPIGSPFVLTASFAFLGVQMILAIVHGKLSPWLKLETGDPVWTGSLWGTLVLAYGIGGFLTSRTSPLPRYSYAIAAAAVAFSLNAAWTLVLSLLGAIRIQETPASLALTLSLPLVTTIGAGVGLRQRLRAASRRDTNRRNKSEAAPIPLASSSDSS